MTPEQQQAAAVLALADISNASSLMWRGRQRLRSTFESQKEVERVLRDVELELLPAMQKLLQVARKRITELGETSR